MTEATAIAREAARGYIGRCGGCGRKVREAFTARHGDGHLFHTAIQAGGAECGGRVHVFGVCRECGCTYGTPCLTPLPCSWANVDQTLCTACGHDNDGGSEP